MVPVFFLRVKSRRVAYVALSRSLGSVGWGPTYSRDPRLIVWKLERLVVSDAVQFRFSEHGACFI